MTLDSQRPTAHDFVSQRLRLHYVDWGNHAAPTLVLLHGARDHCRSWDDLAVQLSKQWHVVVPDLRGHGDSQWSQDGHYGMDAFVYDLATLIEQLQLAPLRLVGHSLGGNICLRYAGIYPDKVSKVVTIEGLGPSPSIIAEEAKVSIAERMQKWIAEQTGLAKRSPRRIATFEEALQRMQKANPTLAAQQVHHLTQHGVLQHPDGSYSWKFDHYLNSWTAIDMTRAEIHELWARITSPVLMIYGKDSWASNPLEDGRAKYFRHGTVAMVEQAGHWLHHDQPEVVMNLLNDFL
jgi:pimeloyl-ACP methyl ester carboxylesterase